MRMPLYSPARAAFLMHLGNLYADPEIATELLGFMGSRIPINRGLAWLPGLDEGDYLNAGGISPFGIGLDPENLSAAVTPAVGFPVKALTGLDTRDLSTVSRPPGQKGLDAFARPTSPSALGRLRSGDVAGALGEVGYNAAGVLPQTRAIRNLALDPNVSRYDSGNEYGPKDDVVPISRYAIEALRGASMPVPDLTREQLARMNRKLREARR
jgi:hypothetical protein